MPNIPEKESPDLFLGVQIPHDTLIRVRALTIIKSCTIKDMVILALDDHIYSLERELSLAEKRTYKFILALESINVKK